jgi:hypothetical protein
MPPQIDISKNGIRTMKKDIDLLEGRVSLDVNVNSNELKDSAIKAEREARVKEDSKIKQLEEQGRKIAEEAARKTQAIKDEKIRKEQEVARVMAAKAEEERRKAETERIMALREARKKVEEEERKRLEEERELARKKEEAEAEKRRLAVIRIREEEKKKKEAETNRIKEEAAKARTIQEETVAKEKRAETDKALARAEEEKKRAAAKGPRETFLEEKSRIIKEKNSLKEEILAIEKEKNVLEMSKKEALDKIDGVEKEFKDIEAEEKKIEEEIQQIEEKESLLKTDGEKRVSERKRWQLEDKRHNLEKERWPWDEKLQEAEKILYDIETQINNFTEKRNNFSVKEKEVLVKEEKNLLGLEKIKLEDELKGMDDLKSSIEKKVDSLFEAFNEIKAKADKISNEEAEIREKKKTIEEAEKSTASLTQRKRLEQDRWIIEEKIREVESRKWVADGEKKKVGDELKAYQDKLKSFGLRKEEALRRLEEVNQKLEGRVPVIEKKEEPVKPPVLQPIKPVIKSEPEPQSPVPPAPEAGLDRIDVARKRIEAMKKTTFTPNVQPKPMPVVQPNIPTEERESSQERAKRIEEEKKDVQRMIIEDQEREDIATRIDTPNKTYLSEPVIKQDKTVVVPEGLIRIVPKKPGWKEKLWIRLLIIGFVVIVLMGILTFWYWYFRIRNQIPVSKEGEEMTQQIIAPAPLFPMDGSTIVYLKSDNNIYNLLEEYFKTGLIQSKFNQIVVGKNGKVLELNEFLTELQSVVSQDLLSKLDSSFTLFSYGQGKGRIGFVVKAKGEGLKVAFEKEKKNLEGAFDSLIFTSGENKSDVNTVLYASDYYLIMTNSPESMTKATEEMEKILTQKVLVKDLKIGDQGENVKLLQTWLARDISVYPEHLIDSRFGQVTMKAVVRFQDKYAAEILTPQKQTKGTGIVDLLTRKKLNSLYSDF